MNLVLPLRATRLAKARRLSAQEALDAFDAQFDGDPSKWSFETVGVLAHLVKGSILQLSSSKPVVEISTTELRKTGRRVHDLWSKLIYPAKQGHVTFDNAGRVVEGHCSRYDAFGHLARLLHKVRTGPRVTYEALFSQVRWILQLLADRFSNPLDWVERHLRARFFHLTHRPEPTYMKSFQVKGREPGVRTETLPGSRENARVVAALSLLKRFAERATHLHRQRTVL